MNSKDIISSLKRLEKKLDEVGEKDFFDIFKYYGPIGAILTTLHPGDNNGQIPNLFVRASNYDPRKEKILTTDRLKYPPTVKNKSYQRASTPSRPMFYAVKHKSIEHPDINSAIRTCLLETIGNYEELLSTEQRVVISLFYNFRPLTLFSIFGWSEFQSKNHNMQEINSDFERTLRGLSPELLNNTKLLLDYLAERYCIPVGQNESQYKPSAILTQYLLNYRYLEADGVIFPSVKSNGHELNVAIIPNSYEQKMCITKVMDCIYKPNKIVEIQKRAIVQRGFKKIKFNENVSIEINLND